MTDTPLHLSQLRGKITESLFEKALQNNRRLNLITAHLGTIPNEHFAARPDKIGDQQSGGWAAHAVLTSLDYSLLSNTKLGSRQMMGTIKQNDLLMMTQGSNSIADMWASDTDKVQNVIFAWDRENIANIRYRGIKGPAAHGGSESAVVSVKKMVRGFFGDLGEMSDDTKIESIVGSFDPNANYPAGSSQSFLKQSFSMFEKPISEMNKAEQIEAVRNAVFMKAESEGGIPKLKQMLYHAGVKDMEGISKLIHDPVDPYGIGKIFENAIKPDSKGAFYSDHKLGTDMEPFLKKAEHFYGPTYTQQKLRPFMQELYEKGGQDLGFLISEQGGLYVGKAGVHSSYVSLPAQILDDQVTEAGFQPGRLITGNRLRNVRQIARGSEGTYQAEPAINVLLDRFKSGLFDPYEGLAPGNEAIALKSARGRVSSMIGDLATNIQSRGEVATMQTLAVSQGIVAPQTFESVRNAFTNVVGSVGRMEDTRAAWDAYKKAIDTMPYPQGADSSLLYTVKAKEAVLASNEMVKWTLPGAETRDDRIKGTFHQNRPLEVTQPRTLVNIRAGIKAMTNRESQAGSVGMLQGEFEALTNWELSNRGIEGKITGRLGREGVANYPMLVSFVPGFTAHEERTLFGDPALQLTDIGRQMHSGMTRPTEAFKAKMTRDQFRDILSSLAGGDLDERPEFKKVFDSVVSGERVFPEDRGLYIDPEAYKATSQKFRGIFGNLPDGGSRLTLIDAAEFDKVVTLGFSSTGTPSAVSTLVGGLRATMVSPKGLGHFGPLEEGVGAVTGMQTLQSIKPGPKFLSHYSQLSNFIEGGPEKFAELYSAEAKKRGLTEDLIEFKRSPSGAGHLVVNSAKHRDKDFIREFTGVGAKVLRDAGVPIGVIQGKAEAMAKFLGRPTKGIPKGAIQLFLPIGQRIEETAEIKNQRNSFRIRLDMIRRFARGAELETGIKPKDDPFFMSMAKWYQRSTGTQFTDEFLESGIVGPTNIFKKLPLNLRILAASGQGAKAVEALAAAEDIKILTQQQVVDIFLRGPHALSLSQELTTGEYTIGDLKNSALFNTANRPDELKKGFFIKLDTPTTAPATANSYGSSGKILQDVQYAPVPAVGKKIFGVPLAGADELTQKLPVDGLERNTLGLISSFVNEPGTKGVVKGTTQEYLSDSFRSIAAMTKKDGGLLKALTAKRMPGGYTGRMLPHPIDDLASTLNRAINLTEEDLTVGISKRGLKKAARSFNKKLRGGRTVGDFTKELIEKAEKGELYGATYPYPVHTGLHRTVIKYRLIKSVEDAGKIAEPNLMMSPFAMWLHHRDTDKDAIQAYIEASVIHKSTTQEQRTVFMSQFERMNELYAQFRRSLDIAKKAGKTTKEFLDEHKAAYAELNLLTQKQLQFGTTPPLAFALEYGKTGMGDEIADLSKSDAAVAMTFNKQASTKDLVSRFTSEEILATRTAMAKHGGRDIRYLSQVAGELYGNQLQGFILKGGKFTEPLIDFMSHPHEILKSVRQGGTLEESIAISEKAFLKVYQEMSKEGKLQMPSAVVLEAADRGISPNRLAAQQSAAVFGPMLHLKASKLTESGLKRLGAASMDTWRDATRQRAEGTGGTVESLVKAITGEGLGDNIGTGPTVTASQAGAAAANEATKNSAKNAGQQGAKQAGSDVAEKVGGWLGKNWKMVAGIGGGIIALRTVSSMLSSDELERPPLRSSKALDFGPAPLPPEPMVSQPMPEVNAGAPLPRAHIQRASARTSINSYRGDYSSVNNSELNVAISSMPIAPNFGSFNIKDSRSYQSNWELQQLASQADESDFLNPYGYS